MTEYPLVFALSNMSLFCLKSNVTQKNDALWCFMMLTPQNRLKSLWQEPFKIAMAVLWAKKHSGHPKNQNQFTGTLDPPKKQKFDHLKCDFQTFLRGSIFHFFSQEFDQSVSSWKLVPKKKDFDGYTSGWPSPIKILLMIFAWYPRQYIPLYP